jgi:uncharacterized membrane protein
LELGSATHSIAKPADSIRDSAQNASENNFAQVQAVLQARCAQCHGAQVQMKNIRLDSPEQIKLHAQGIYNQVVVTQQMPMNNSTQITSTERALIGQWFKSGAATN